MTINDDLLSLLPFHLRLEISENIAREDLSPSDLDAGRRVIEPHLEAIATERQRAGGRLKGDGKLPPAEKFKVRDVAAELLKTSRRTLDKIEKVINAAKENPKRFGRLVEEMDRACTVDGPYRRLLEARRHDRIGQEVPPEPPPPVVRLGEIWILGGHRLMCGDSTMQAHVNRLLGGTKPHLMVTDVPYGVNYDPEWRANVLGRHRRPPKVMNDDRADWREAFALFPGTVAYVLHGTFQSDIVIGGLEAVGFERRDLIVWIKPQFVIGRGDYQSHHEDYWYAVRKGKDSHWVGGRDKSNVWQIARPQGPEDERVNHATQKPVECMRRPIENSSQPGDAVYDPFVGSGTTIIAAEIAGRSCYAMDLDPTCCTTAIGRWQKFTGRQAILKATRQTFDEVERERSPRISEADTTMVPVLS
jgi:DNA modification methylase